MSIKNSSNKDEFDDWNKKKANFKHMIKNTRHLFWPKECNFKRIGLFGSSGYTVLTFAYCPVTLKQEIINRTKSNVSFQQKELWYLLYSLVSLA